MKPAIAYYLERIADDSAALVEAARVDLGAPVPSCPGWTMGDLVWHTGWVQRQKAWIVKDNKMDVSAWVAEPEPTEEELIDWFRAGADELVTILGAADPDAPAFNWSREPDTVGFWPRRMAHETSVHRWDAQNAVGAPEAIDSDLAADGVDELLDVWAPTWNGGPGRPHGSIHLHRTDGDGEWFVRTHEKGVDVSHEHAKGDVAVRGPASDLLLMLWRRVLPDELEMFGASPVLELFLAWADLS